jgi:hypothetical protein
MTNKIFSFFFFIIYLFLIIIFFHIVDLNKISDGLESNKYFFYAFFVTIFFLFTLIYKIKLSNKYRDKIFFLVLFSIILSVTFIEFLLDFYNFKKKNYLKKISINSNLSTKSLYLDLLKNNQRLKYSFSPNTINFDNKNFFFSSFSNAKTFLCIEDEETGPVIIKNDKFGFHNDNYKWGQNETYLFIGDSFVQGWCVNSKNNFINKFNKKNLNLGVQNTGPLVQYAILKEYLKYTNTKKIIWFFYEGNDIEDMSHEKRNKILLKYLKNRSFSQRLPNRQQEINSQNYLTLKKFINLYNNESIKINNKYIDHLNIKNILVFKNIRTLFNTILFKTSLYEKILVEAKNLATSHNIDLIMVYFPSYERYMFKNNIIRNIHYREILKIFKKNELKYIDLKKNFFDKRQVLTLYPKKKRGHLNEKGHEELSKFLKEKIN